MLCLATFERASASFSRVYPAWNCFLWFSAALLKQEHLPFWEFALLSGGDGVFLLSVCLDCSVRGLPGVGAVSATWATLVANDGYNCRLMLTSSGGSVVAGLLV